MRIAYVTDTYLPETNGIVTAIARHARVLASHGHSVLIVCPRYGDDDPSDEPGVTVQRLPSMRAPSNPDTRFAPGCLPAVRRRLKAFAPDLVHVHTPLPIGVAGVVAARTLRLPLVETYHSYVPGFMQYASLSRLLGLDRRPHRYADEAWLAWGLTRLLYNRADLVLAPSETLCRVLAKHGVRKPVRYQTNGIDLSEFPPRADWSLKRRILHTGRLGYEKSVEVVLEAFARFAERRPGWELHLMGEGPAAPHLASVASRLGISHLVRREGFVSRKRLAEAYRDADFYATASTIETQGLVLLEAMASGTPVVGVDALAVPEMVRDGRNGLIVPPFDPGRMAAAFERLADDEALRRRMGQANIEDVRGHDLLAAVATLEETYAGVLAARQRR